MNSCGTEVASIACTGALARTPNHAPRQRPGENIGPADGAWLSDLRVLQHGAEAFPGFAKEIEGAIEIDGSDHVYGLKR